jgi:hypothetical protein
LPCLLPGFYQVAQFRILTAFTSQAETQIIKDGDEVYVEYGRGPQALTVRWEGRPDESPFQWGDEGVVLPSHDLWLQQLDLYHEKIDDLISHAPKDQDPATRQDMEVVKDMESVKAFLIRHAGSLQACFFFYECQVRALRFYYKHTS